MPCRTLGNGFRMGFRNIPNLIVLFLLLNIGKIEWLLLHRNSASSNDSIHGLTGHNVDMAGIMKTHLNLTAEL